MNSRVAEMGYIYRGGFLPAGASSVCWLLCLPWRSALNTPSTQLAVSGPIALSQSECWRFNRPLMKTVCTAF